MDSRCCKVNKGTLTLESICVPVPVPRSPFTFTCMFARGSRDTPPQCMATQTTTEFRRYTFLAILRSSCWICRYRWDCFLGLVICKAGGELSYCANYAILLADKVALLPWQQKLSAVSRSSHCCLDLVMNLRACLPMSAAGMVKWRINNQQISSSWHGKDFLFE